MMVVGSEQWISEAVLAVAIGVPVPALFVAVAVALLAMVTTASTLHLLLEATQSIKRGMSECMSIKCGVEALLLHDELIVMVLAFAAGC